MPQAKMQVNDPEDAFEQEADQAADQVVSMKEEPNSFFRSGAIQRSEKEENIQKKTGFPTITPVVQKMEEEPPVQKKQEEEVQRELQEDVQTQSEEEVQTKKDEEPIQTKEEEIQKQEEEPVQTKQEEESLQAQQEEEVQAKGEGGGAVSPSVERGISATKGAGSPLGGTVKGKMESGFGADFSGVNIHTDSKSVQMNRDLGAQAFTQGNDIYFNEGKYNPASKDGQHLLAHELTHTMQQGSSIKKSIQRNTETPGLPTQAPSEILKTFYLPAVKARHLQTYQAWAAGNRLKRKKDFSRDTSPEDKPEQVKNWKDQYWDKLQNTEDLGLHEEFTGVKEIKIPGERKMRGRRKTLLKNLTIPDWNKSGVVQEDKARYEVDHIVELQVAGWASSPVGNDFPNLELLDGTSNASSGSKTRSNVEKIVRNYLEASGVPSTQADAQAYMANNDVVFERVELGADDFAGSGELTVSAFWTREEITQGLHLGELEDLGNVGEPGSPTDFALMTPDDGYLMDIFPHEESQLSFGISPESSNSKSVAGLKISQIALNAGYETLNKDAGMGSVSATWDLPKDFNAPESPFQIPLIKSESQYAGRVGNLPALGLNFNFLSPVSFGGLEITEEGLSAEGTLTPSLPFLQNSLLRVGVRGKELYFRGEYSPSDISLPIPGVKINSSTFHLEYSTLSGFGVGGDVELEIPKIGVGTISSGFTAGEGLYFRGNIAFDPSLFGNTQASARLAYENNLWSAGGTLSIPANTVRGIKEATINVDYSQAEGFTAVGTAMLDVPGVDTGSMAITFNEEGFSIAGEFNLKPDIPGIRGGSVEARVSQAEGEEGYSVFVSGTAQPDIPGINSTLNVTYENGALTIVGNAGYSRGMLSGTLEVGATNRAIGDDGQPTGEPDDTIRVYGGGSLTLQLTPWLAATAGVKFLPNGEMEVTARLATDSYDVFPRREYNKNLFRVPTIEIPLFAIPLGPRSLGLVAQIGGGLDFTAGFGPGQLRNLSAEITYNPDHEEETTVNGHGEFAIPADAGLTLSGDLSLGVSVGVASLTGGIELAGTLGLEGEAAAGVDVNWSPQTGLSLDAQGSIMVNPKFTFDINAFARASLGIGWFSISETWRHNLTSFSWGPDIQFGIVFPVHYTEGEPFDMSLDDIEVIYPDIQVVEMAKGLARDIKNDLFG